ncbi:hypothetical protein L6452_32598 [Arctium lappa]|uniref:Uncharacterized protein n=1 Tax=Arctium lappa TaxID=4217 RepID=A0ACB8Z658_ARCLA|nr:hypothetical protein L6452_32598 [Arctium lappa]
MKYVMNCLGHIFYSLLSCRKMSETSNIVNLACGYELNIIVVLCEVFFFIDVLHALNFVQYLGYETVDDML